VGGRGRNLSRKSKLSGQLKARMPGEGELFGKRGGRKGETMDLFGARRDEKEKRTVQAELWEESL